MQSVTRVALRPIQDCYCDERSEAGNNLENVVVEGSCSPIRELGGVLNLKEVPQGARGKITDAAHTVCIYPHSNVSLSGLLVS